MKWSIIGHEKQIEFLQKSVANNKIAHAYLFYGPKNIGLFTTAIEFAKFLTCPNKDSSCQCKICQDIENQRYPDVKIYTGNEIISIKELKDLLHDLNLKPFYSSYKIGIIKEASRLTLEAQNAFLKTLEEPPPKTILILTTSYPQILLPTIISRCQQVKFGLVGQNKIKDFLIKKGLKEKEAESFAYLSGGRVGEALSFLEKDKRQLYKDSISSVLKIMSSDLSGKFQLAQQLSKKENLDKILDYWIIYFRGALLNNLAVNNQFFDFAQRKQSTAIQNSKKLLNLLKEILEIQKILRKQSLQKGINIRLLLENLSCQMEII